MYLKSRNGMVSTEEMNRMRWATRRGMLELDLVLGPFVTARYALLAEKDREIFQRLMASEDQDLFAWLLQRGQPEDEELVDIVSQILHFTRSSSEHT
jgi:antitoxin CptB